MLPAQEQAERDRAAREWNAKKVQRYLGVAKIVAPLLALAILFGVLFLMGVWEQGQGVWQLAFFGTTLGWVQVSSMRLAHRFAADQTFGGGDPTEWRLRYRLGTELPLNGQEADPKELYLKINNEYLGSWQGNDSDLEIRLVPVLGYLFTDKNKLEFGLDYRIDSFLANEARQRFWGVLAWYYKW